MDYADAMYIFTAENRTAGGLDPTGVQDCCQCAVHVTHKFLSGKTNRDMWTIFPSGRTDSDNL